MDVLLDFNLFDKKEYMEKKALCLLMSVVVLLLSAFCLVACNEGEVEVLDGEYIEEIMKIATSPKESLLSGDDLELISQAMDESIEIGNRQALIKEAVIMLYERANSSRIDNKGVSLMVQRSLGGNAQGRVYMRGFTLQNGDSWYYQLPAQASLGDTSGFETIAKLMAPIVGNLQIAYTTQDNGYDYFYIMGTKTKIDCTINSFPYATYVIPNDATSKHYDTFEEYQADRNCRYSQLELNNMGVLECCDLLTNCTLEHKDGYYLLTFEVDCENATQEQMVEFQKYSKLDLDIGVLPIDNTIKKWRAELEVWDSGYAKAFRSYEAWDMVVTVGFKIPIESTPSNEFVYVWNADEILKIVAQDGGAKEIIEANLLASDVDKIQTCINFYSAKAQNKTITVFDYSTLVLAIVGVIVVALIITIVTLVILFKKGKLVKLASVVEKNKARRRAVSEKKKARCARRRFLKAEKKSRNHTACQGMESVDISSIDI